MKKFILFFCSILWSFDGLLGSPENAYGTSLQAYANPYHKASASGGISPELSSAYTRPSLETASLQAQYTYNAFETQRLLLSHQIFTKSKHQFGLSLLYGNHGTIEEVDTQNNTTGNIHKPFQFGLATRYKYKNDNISHALQLKFQTQKLTESTNSNFLAALDLESSKDWKDHKFLIALYDIGLYYLDHDNKQLSWKKANTRTSFLIKSPIGSKRFFIETGLQYGFYQNLNIPFSLLYQFSKHFTIFAGLSLYQDHPLFFNKKPPKQTDLGGTGLSIKYQQWNFEYSISYLQLQAGFDHHVAGHYSF